MKNIQLKNKTHKNISLITAFSLNLAIHLFALGAYSTFKYSVNQSNAPQVLAEFLNID